jgi:hypothetical protein
MAGEQQESERLPKRRQASADVLSFILRLVDWKMQLDGITLTLATAAG